MEQLFTDAKSNANDVERFLILHNIAYEKEKSIEELNNQRFDYWLKDYHTFIEYDGIQHFKPIEYFGGKEEFENRQIRDAMKDEYCRRHDVTLIRIPYTHTQHDLYQTLSYLLNIDTSDEELPLIDQFIEVECHHRKLFITHLYKRYGMMIKDLEIDHIKVTLDMFEKNLINKLTNKGYTYHDKIEKVDNIYTRCLINEQVEKEVQDELNQEYLFLEKIKKTRLLNLDVIPTSILYAIYIDNVPLTEHKSQSEFTRQIDDFMYRNGYKIDTSKTCRVKKYIQVYLQDIDSLLLNDQFTNIEKLLQIIEQNKSSRYYQKI